MSTIKFLFVCLLATGIGISFALLTTPEKTVTVEPITKDITVKNFDSDYFYNQINDIRSIRNQIFLAKRNNLERDEIDQLKFEKNKLINNYNKEAKYFNKNIFASAGLPDIMDY